MNQELKTKREALDKERTELKAFFDERKDKDTGKVRGLEPQEFEEYEKREAACKSLVGEIVALEKDELIQQAAEENEAGIKAMRDPRRGFPFPGQDGWDKMAMMFQDQVAQVKSIGERFIESPAYKAFVERKAPQPEKNEFFKVDDEKTLTFNDAFKAVKATLTTTGLTGYQRPPGVVVLGTQRPRVADLLAKGETQSPTVRYVRETAFTNAATNVAEGAAKPQATFALAEVDAPVRKIAVTAKVTDEMFSDFTMIRDYVNQRLPLMVALQEDAQLLNGDGTGSNLTGILNTAGIQTQATGTDENQDAIYRALVKVRTVGFFEPDGIVLHPNNFTPVRLLRGSTGQYLYGDPSAVGPDTLWGLTVVTTTTDNAGTGLVGAFQLGAQIWYRMGITVDATNSNEDDFLKNLVAIRAEQREALAVYRALAFCSVTGLA